MHCAEPAEGQEGEEVALAWRGMMVGCPGAVRMAKLMAGVVGRSEIRPWMDGFDLEVRLRLPGRVWLVVGFVGFWLCGWAAGECFGGWFLWNTLRVLVRSYSQQAVDMAVEATTRPAADGAPWGAWVTAAFMGVWLVGWTMGGIGAMYQMASLLRGRVVYEFRRDGVGSRGRPGEAARATCDGTSGGRYCCAAGGLQVCQANGAWQVVCSVPGEVIEFGPFADEAGADALVQEMTKWYRGLRTVTGGQRADQAGRGTA